MSDKYDVLLIKGEIQRDENGLLSTQAVNVLKSTIGDTLGMSLDNTKPSMFIASRGQTPGEENHNRGRMAEDYMKMSAMQKDISMITTIMSQNSSHHADERSATSVSLLSQGITQSALDKFVKDGYLQKDGAFYHATDAFKVESYNVFISY